MFNCTSDYDYKIFFFFKSLLACSNSINRLWGILMLMLMIHVVMLSLCIYTVLTGSKFNSIQFIYIHYTNEAAT